MIRSRGLHLARRSLASFLIHNSGSSLLCDYILNGGCRSFSTALCNQSRGRSNFCFGNVGSEKYWLKLGFFNDNFGAARSIHGTAPCLTQRTSDFSVVHNQCLGALRHELYSSTTAKVDSGNENGKTEKINVTFVDKDGEELHIKVPLGMSMLEAAHENDIELEGACEGSLACSTCHVIVMDMDQYNKLPDPTDEENDMLDLAFGLTETSRLGCQIIAEPEFEGLRLALPSATRNFAVDGYKPKPH